MKQRYTLILLLALLMGSALPGLSQQIPVSLTQMFRTGMWNPAHSGAVDLNNIHLSHQQRKMTIPGWRSISQFLNYNSQPMGRHGNFGVGALISNDIEHTENRLGMNFAIAVHPVFTKQQRLSLGGSVGMINWNSNYSKAKVFDRNDELIQRAPNFLELDAGLGAEYALWTKKVEFQVSGSAVQLPGNFMSRRLNGLRLNPHLLVGGELLGAPAHNLKVGPVAFYKNTFLRGDTTIGGVRSDSLLLGNTAAMDVGLKGKLDRQDIWAAASYRFNFASLNFAFGAQIYVSDSAKHPTSSVLLVDLNAGFSYPLQESNVFGPTIEFGIDIHFGRPFRKRIDKDSVRFAQKFWENDGTIARHIEDHLAINSPVGLRGNTSVAPK
ncbi:MAG: type IX secretion system membrane protein PorP/SprF, partial [Bacteroidota bacterium]